ncbi:MAG: M4 family metallopeptidase [Ferruginibacter sp.]
MKLKYFLLFITTVFATVFCCAQPSLSKLKTRNVSIKQAYTVLLNTKHSTQATLKLPASSTIRQQDAVKWFAEQMQLRSSLDEMRLLDKKIVTKDKWEIEHLQQYYKGIKVQFGTVSMLSFKGKVKLLQAEFYPVPEDISTHPGIPEATALENAKQVVGAAKYVWESYQGTDPKYKMPVAELVFIQHPAQPGKMLLCFRFDIIAEEPENYVRVFINAADGSCVYRQNLQHQPFPLKKGMSVAVSTREEHYQEDSIAQFKKLLPGVVTAVAEASGDTRYSGQKTFITDNESTDPGKPYRLQAINYNFYHDIITLNYEGRNDLAIGNNQLAKDFTDNDNVWQEYTDADRYTPNVTRSGVDVHFNMQTVSDYWLNIHGRNSWDDKGAAIKSYVNCGNPNPDNAAWRAAAEAMFFRNGTFARTNLSGLSPVTTLDIAGHELAHAVGDKLIPGGGLKYEAEPGALDEGFSDIWGACIENYFNEKFPADKAKNIWLTGEELQLSNEGARNFKYPRFKYNPENYKGEYWAPTEPNPTEPYYDEERNDYGGVHTNSSILVKWFSLIVDGGKGYAPDGFNYSIEPLGIKKAEQLVYKMEGMLTPSSDYITARNVSVAAAEELMDLGAEYPITKKDLDGIKQAWAAVGLGTGVELFNTGNTKSFTTDVFSSVAVGKDGYVWAGTNKQGLYKYNGAYWEKATVAVSNYNINDIKTDKQGGIWVAESGTEPELNAGGGVFHFPDTVFTGRSFYDEVDGMQTRNTVSLFVDTAFNDGQSPRVWVAAMAANKPAEGGTKKGGVCFGPNGSGQFDRRIAEVKDSTTGIETIGGDKNEVWAFARINTITGASQLLRYNAVTGSFNGTYDYNSVLAFTEPAFIAQSIYFDANGNKWIGLSNNGLVIQDKDASWHNVYLSDLFPDGVRIQRNCIAGNADSIFIGTNKGLVIYNNKGLDNAANFRKLTIADGLPSDDINSICVDTARGGIWIATNEGIGFIKLKDDSRSIGVTTKVSTCPDELSITVTTSGAFYNKPSANKFSIWLSDENGSFDNAVLLATEQAAPQAAHQFTKVVPLPAGLKFSYKYRVSVTSTSPVLTGVSKEIELTGIMPAIARKEYTADYECEGVGGWTNYYDDNGTAKKEDDILLLSLRKNGNHLGTVNYDASDMDVITGTTQKIGSGTAIQVTDPALATSFWSMNRYWKVFVIASNQPSSAVDVRFYYNDYDLTDVNGSQPGNPVDHTGLVFYKTDGNPDPSTNFQNNTYINSYTHEVDGNTIPTVTWKHTDLGGGMHMAEFQVTGFSGGGAGVTLNGGPLTITKTYSVKNGNWSDPATWSTGIVPTATIPVEILHDVKVNINGSCRSIKIQPQGKITINTGFNLEVAK